MADMSDNAGAAKFLTRPIVQTAFDLAENAGGEGRLVGGCVRDWLLGRPIGDLDMAVTIPICHFCEVAKQQNYRIIETGIDHGSVTLVIGQETLEITQTRSDLQTDGRHAVIGFAPSFEEDATRRDFTINALYLDRHGQCYDPVGGKQDLQARIIRFIGKPDDRITEDYLRILRFYRFLAQIDDLVPEPQALAAIANHVSGLSGLSGERVLAEVIKLFSAITWQKSAYLLTEAGIDHALFHLQGYDVQKTRDGLLDWQSRFAYYLGQEGGGDRSLPLPLSRADQKKISYLRSPISDHDWALLSSEKWQEFAYFEPQDLAVRCLVQARYHDAALSQDRQTNLANFVPPPCPVTGHDLRQAGIPQGPELGRVLHQVKLSFVQSDYQLDCAALLAKVRDIS